MASFAEAVREGAKSALCTVIGGPQAVPYVSSPQASPVDFVVKQVNAARRFLCNSADEITEEDVGEPPEFSGGQCAVAYVVTLVGTTEPFKRCDNGQQASGTGPGNNAVRTRTVVGPLSGFRAEPISGGCGAVAGYSYFISGASGEELIGSIVTGFPSQVECIFDPFLSIQVARVDGQPDTCGNPPPPPIPPYVPSPIVINIEYQDNDNVTINEDVTYNIFAPIVLIGGAIIAPVTISGNDFSLVGELQLNGELNVDLNPEFNFGPRGQVDTQPPDPDAPYPQPEPPMGSRAIVGAIVTATTVSSRPATQIGQDGNPDIFAPRVGNLAFYIATDKGSAWTADIPIKNVRQYVPCPSNFGAVDVAATAESGWALNVEPVWDYPGLP